LHAPEVAAGVPEEVDRRVVAMARWHFGRRVQVAHRRPGAAFSLRARTRRAPLAPLLRLGALTAAAAALLMVVLIVPRAMRPAAPSGSSGPGAMGLAPGGVREDIDGNGRVDILDAFALARSIRDGGGGGRAEWDVTGDGRVDEADVKAIAAAAVRLEQMGGAG
jgi:hypothetical protein